MQQVAHFPVDLGQCKRCPRLHYLFIEFAEHPHSRQVDVRRRGEVDYYQFDPAGSTPRLNGERCQTKSMPFPMRS
jgi:hypothetical protein